MLGIAFEKTDEPASLMRKTPKTRIPSLGYGRISY
jgi:hypothetical protein